jgi:hypothetical protein
MHSSYILPQTVTYKWIRDNGIHVMALQAHLIVPTEKDRAKEVVQTLTLGFVTTFGGYSKYEGSGGWEGESGVETEDHVRLVVTHPGERLDEDQFREYMRVDALYVKDILDEEAVLLEFRDVDVEFV